MGFVRTFENVKPPVRTDGVPYSTALIEESPVPDLGWLQIDSIDLLTQSQPALLDLNPFKPIRRTFTTSQAAYSGDAYYRITWQDANSNQYVESPTFFGSSELSALEALVRLEVPTFWDSMCDDDGNGSIGLAGLKARVKQTRYSTLPVIVAAQDPLVWPYRLQSYVAKVCALDLIPTMMEYWMRRRIQISTSGTSEQKTNPDPTSALRQVAANLARQVAALSTSDEIIEALAVAQASPAVSGNDDLEFRTLNPFVWEAGFNNDTDLV